MSLFFSIESNLKLKLKRAISWFMLHSLRNLSLLVAIALFHGISDSTETEKI